MLCKPFIIVCTEAWVSDTINFINIKRYSNVLSILNEQLGMGNLFACWVSHWLTIHHKRNRVITSKEYLALFDRNTDYFCHCVINVDETLIHLNPPKTKQQSKQSISTGEKVPGYPRWICQPTKSLRQFFQNAPDIIYTNYLQKEQSMTKADIMPTYWTGKTKIWGRNDRKRKRKRYGSKDVIISHSESLYWEEVDKFQKSWMKESTKETTLRNKFFLSNNLCFISKVSELSKLIAQHR